MGSGVVRNAKTQTDRGPEHEADIQSQKEKDLQDTKNRISEIESMPTDNKEQKVKREFLWFKAKVELEDIDSKVT